MALAIAIYFGFFISELQSNGFDNMVEFEEKVHSVTLTNYCQNGCAWNGWEIIRIDESFHRGLLREGQKLFLLTLEFDPCCCGSAGCLSHIYLRTRERMVHLHSGWGITSERAERIALGRLRDQQSFLIRYLENYKIYWITACLLMLCLFSFFLQRKIVDRLSFSQKILLATTVGFTTSGLLYYFGLAVGINLLVIPLIAGVSVLIVASIS